MNNDLISRSALVSDYEDYLLVCESGGLNTAHEMLEAAREAPAIDAVEVVRCKDCRNGMFTKFSKGEPILITCTHKNMFPLRVEPEFYCAHGAKMDGRWKDAENQRVPTLRRNA